MHNAGREKAESVLCLSRQEKHRLNMFSVCIRMLVAGIMLLVLADSEVTAHRPTPAGDLQSQVTQLQIHTLARFAEVATRLDDVIRALNASQTCPSTGDGESPERCPPGYTYLAGTGSCYEIVLTKASWLDALLRCEVQYGAHLLELNTLEEFVAVERFLSSSRIGETGLAAYWTSGREVVGEGTWRWVTSSTPMTLTSSWGTNQPDNAGGGEHCLELRHVAGSDYRYYLNDIPCDRVNRYICEIRSK